MDSINKNNIVINQNTDCANTENQSSFRGSVIKVVTSSSTYIAIAGISIGSVAAWNTLKANPYICGQVSQPVASVSILLAGFGCITATVATASYLVCLGASKIQGSVESRKN